MVMLKTKENGFHVVLLIVLLAVCGVIGFVGYVVFTKAQDKVNADVRWSYNSVKNEWFVKEGIAPTCKDPYVFAYTPVQLSDASSVGFAGTYRNKSYKVHGGFGLTKSSQVVLPADATLSSLTRYYEGDPLELQYLVGFEMDCGIAFYFDHIHTLSPELQALAEKQPEPKENDTRTSPDDAPPRVKLKAGTVIATETGAHKAGRYGIDFGVVDYRTRNSISKNSAWVSMHSEFAATEWFGVCWYDMLPNGDAEKAKQLSLVQIDTRKTVKYVSDYCDNADYTTLDFNNGQPVDFY